MTFGEKIRKFRVLNGMTQKELGMAVGFPVATADSRIRKYESGKMSPKKEIKEKLIAALDVDESALTKTEISNVEDVMHLLFELEEKWGMKTELRNDVVYFSFDEAMDSAQTLIAYLNIWMDKKVELLPDLESLCSDQINAYEKWKSRFVISESKQKDSKES